MSIKKGISQYTLVVKIANGSEARRGLGTFVIT
jgi:hypothetical protein